MYRNAAGVGFGDLDNDGDQDIFQQMGGAYPGDAYPSVLYENPGHGNRWVTLILEGSTSNRSAIGTRVKVTVERTGITRDVHVVASTLSARARTRSARSSARSSTWAAPEIECERIVSESCRGRVRLRVARS
jgi:hypothetical protein